MTCLINGCLRPTLGWLLPLTNLASRGGCGLAVHIRIDPSSSDSLLSCRVSLGTEAASVIHDACGRVIPRAGSPDLSPLWYVSQCNWSILSVNPSQQCQELQSSKAPPTPTSPPNNGSDLKSRNASTMHHSYSVGSPTAELESPHLPHERSRRKSTLRFPDTQ